MCVLNYKIVKCVIKKKELNRVVEMVVIFWYSLEIYVCWKKIVKFMYWYIWYDYGD